MKNSFLILFIVLFSSCRDAAVNRAQKSINPEINTVKKHAIETGIEKIGKDTIHAWKEYVSVADDLQKFIAISANEALNNALQLADLVKQMKDSIRPLDLINPSFRTRVNVLENEALRLKDMTFISSITSKEVHLQVDKILEAFSATNSKINVVYSQLEVEKEINNTSPINTIKKTNNSKPKKNSIKEKIK